MTSICEISKRGQLVFVGDLTKFNVFEREGFETSESLSHDFFPGTYAVSVLKFGKRQNNSVLVIHQENVDPALIAKKSRAVRGKLKNGSSIGDGCEKKRRKKMLPDDWISTQVSLENEEYFQHLACCQESAVNHWEIGSCGFCNQALKKLLSAGFPVCKTQIDLFRQIYKASGNINEAAPIKFSQLFTFVTSSWLTASKDFKVTTVLGDLMVYEFESRGKIIGFAINPYDMLGNGRKRCVMFCTPTRMEGYRNPSYYRRKDCCFACMIFNMGENYSISTGSVLGYQNINFVFPIEDFLYENEYRCFFKDGKCIENEYYGENEPKDGFDFSRLPESVFIDILLRLPWKQRMTCRRVSRRWLSVGNSALAATTKVIDSYSPRFSSMESMDLAHLLPIVASGLEMIELAKCFQFDFTRVCSMPSFASLRILKLGLWPVDYDGLFSFLDKCPNLKEMEAVIPEKPIDSKISPREYGLEKLGLSYYSWKLLDSTLMAIADHFPKLNDLYLPTCDDVTESCLSSFVERYGETMIRLEICEARFHPAVVKSPFGAFTGIGACSNLTYLSVARTNLVSDAFLMALANGCLKLETLLIDDARRVTNDGLAKLALMPNLKKLSISCIGARFSNGILAIVNQDKWF